MTSHRTLVAWGVPLIAAAAWIGWCLHQVALQEAAMVSRSGMAYAVFVQLGHSWNQGWGWHQTVHPNYLPVWHWGGHYGVIWLAAAKLSALFESPWTLVRLQVVWVGLGCLPSWLLGYWEGQLRGALVGLLLYGASGAVLFIATDDYQDLTLCLPLIPLAVWSARHAPGWLFLVCCALLCTVREELWVLVPLVGLTRSWQRGLLGWLLAAAWFAVLVGCTPILAHPPPLLIAFLDDSATAGGLQLAGVDWLPYLAACGAAVPWLLLQPASAVAVVVVSIVHSQPALGSLTRAWVFSHHFAPIVGFAAAGGTVVLARLARWGRLGGGLALVLALVGTSLSLVQWWPRLEPRLSREPAAPHPAWGLLALLPEDAVLYLPSSLSPAAAKRRWVTHEQSLGRRVEPGAVTHALVPADCGVEGEELARSGDWALVRRPLGLPASGERPPWDLHASSLVGGCLKR